MFKKACLCVMVIIFPLLPSILNAQAPDTLWTRRYNGPANKTDCGQGCTVDSLGNLYVVGYSNNGTNDDYLTIKYNSNGDTIWTRRYNGPANDFDIAHGCAVDDSGNLYVTGYSYISYDENTDYLTIKYNTNGDTIWTRRYNGPASFLDYAFDCAVDDLGNLYVTGSSFNGTDYDYLTIRYNGTGDTLWTRRYDGPDVPANGSDKALSCTVDDSSNIYVTGWSYNGTSNGILTIKYNAAGDIIWTRRYDGPEYVNYYATDCAVDDLGNLYVTGYTHTSFGEDYFTVKYNSAGDTLWSRLYDGPANEYDEALGCAVDGMGNLYVTGWSSNGMNYQDYFTIKYNTTGDTIWTGRYNSTVNDYEEAYGCAVDGSGNLYIAGGSSNGTNWDYLTIKYNTATSVSGKPELPMAVSKLKLEQNRPNPFSRHTTIHYQLPASGQASLKIYNAAGQLVKTFDMGQQQAGYHQVEWNDPNIPAGVYFYSLTAGNHQATKKLVVVK